jgi:hypothetical protein
VALRGWRERSRPRRCVTRRFIENHPKQRADFDLMLRREDRRAQPRGTVTAVSRGGIQFKTRTGDFDPDRWL